MELAIPLIALGGMYVASNQNKNSFSNQNQNQNQNQKQNQNNNSSSKKENFVTMGANPNYLPNTNVPPTNYPILNQRRQTQRPNL